MVILTFDLETGMHYCPWGGQPLASYLRFSLRVGIVRLINSQIIIIITIIIIIIIIIIVMFLERFVLDISANNC